MKRNPMLALVRNPASPGEIIQKFATKADALKAGKKLQAMGCRVTGKPVGGAWEVRANPGKAWHKQQRAVYQKRLMSDLKSGHDAADYWQGALSAEARAVAMSKNPMAVHPEMFERWAKYARQLLAEHNRTVSDVTTPVMAWNIAHKLDIPKEAYHVGLNDRHIETALRRIFPLAWAARKNPTFYPGSGKFSIRLTREQARSVSGPGPADEAVEALYRDPRIARQLARIDAADLRNELREYGAWSDAELQDHTENLKRMLWLAGGGIWEDSRHARRNPGRAARLKRLIAKGYVVKCPGCGKLNAYSWDDAEKHGLAHVKSASGLGEWQCGSCRTYWAEKDSPLLAEAYTHEAQENPGPEWHTARLLEEKRLRQSDLEAAREATELGSHRIAQDLEHSAALHAYGAGRELDAMNEIARQQQGLEPEFDESAESATMSANPGGHHRYLRHPETLHRLLDKHLNVLRPYMRQQVYKAYQNGGPAVREALVSLSLGPSPELESGTVAQFISMGVKEARADIRDAQTRFERSPELYRRNPRNQNWVLVDVAKMEALGSVAAPSAAQAEKFMKRMPGLSGYFPLSGKSLMILPDQRAWNMISRQRQSREDFEAYQRRMDAQEAGYARNPASDPVAAQVARRYITAKIAAAERGRYRESIGRVAEGLVKYLAKHGIEIDRRTATRWTRMLSNPGIDPVAEEWREEVKAGKMVDMLPAEVIDRVIGGLYVESNMQALDVLMKDAEAAGMLRKMKAEGRFARLNPGIDPVAGAYRAGRHPRMPGTPILPAGSKKPDGDGSFAAKYLSALDKLVASSKRWAKGQLEAALQQWAAERGSKLEPAQARALVKAWEERGWARNGRGRRNPSASDIEQARKIKGVTEAMLSMPKFWAALAKYVEFHGCWPVSLSKRDIKGIGTPEQQEFLVNMGKAPDVSYIPTPEQKGSNKAGSAWLHEFNEGGDPNDLKKLPDRLCTADGKLILTHGGQYEVKDWVRK